MSSLLKIIFLTIITLNLAACTVKFHRHGYVFEEDSLKKLQIGKTTKLEVLEIMGTPSTISNFDKNIWYYISNKTKQFSMLKPKNIEEKILQVSFKKNKISNLYIYHDDKVKELAFSKSETPIKGDDTGLLKDFFQNLGRFNKSKSRK